MYICEIKTYINRDKIAGDIIELFIDDNTFLVTAKFKDEVYGYDELDVLYRAVVKPHARFGFDLIFYETNGTYMFKESDLVSLEEVCTILLTFIQHLANTKISQGINNHHSSDDEDCSLLEIVQEEDPFEIKVISPGGVLKDGKLV